MTFDFDIQKAGVLLKYIAKANKKINNRRDAFKKIHEEIKDLKKISAKTTQSKITNLEVNILTALREGGFIIDSPKENSTEQKTTEPPTEIAPTEEKTRTDRINEIENNSIQKAKFELCKEKEVSEIKKSLSHLEGLRRKIKAKSDDEKDKLLILTSKINYFKDQILKLANESSSKKPVFKKNN